MIALGNGTACRETETYLSELIQKGWFRPIDVKYTIVSEQGASIYSCSPIAQKEFSGTDPNVISAGKISVIQLLHIIIIIINYYYYYYYYYY